MIPQYLTANNLDQVRRFRADTVQAVPERDGNVENSFFQDEGVLDLSKYLTTDVSTSPHGYFNDFFDVDKMRHLQPGNNNNFVKVKDEPLDEPRFTPRRSNNSRCSTPDSFAPDEFDKQDFPSPTFQPTPTPTSPMFQPLVANNTTSLLRTVTPLHVLPPTSLPQHAGISSIPGTSAIQAALKANTLQQNTSATVSTNVGGLTLPLFSQLESIQQQRSTNNITWETPGANTKSAANSLALQLTSTASSIASSIQSSANPSDTDTSDDELMTSSTMSQADMAFNAQRLQQALNQLQDGSSADADLKQEPMDMDGVYPAFAHLNKLRQQQGGQFKGKQRKFLEKGTEEYVLKRERNNVAVRKSRTKAKLKHIETQMRVGELNEENSSLRNHISTLQKEMAQLKAFISYHIPNASIASSTNRMPSASTVSRAASTSSVPAALLTVSTASSSASLPSSPAKPQQHASVQQVSPVYSTYGGTSTSVYSPN